MKAYQVIIGTGFDRHGKPIHGKPCVDAMRAIRTKACELFGGYTIHHGQGGWTDDDGRIVEENNVIITLGSDCGVRVGKFARMAGKAFNQNTVVIILPDGEFIFQKIMY